MPHKTGAEQDPWRTPSSERTDCLQTVSRAPPVSTRSEIPSGEILLPDRSERPACPTPDSIWRGNNA
eukprot:649530-Pyramimonas_sp.AAC.1